MFSKMYIHMYMYIFNQELMRAEGLGPNELLMQLNALVSYTYM